MLNILEDTGKQYPKLMHGENVFHDALENVQKGETHFHVENPEGQDYELSYMDNEELLPEVARPMVYKMTEGNRVTHSFLTYKEKDTQSICMEFLSQFQKVEFMGLDEYVVVAAKLMLAHTELELFFLDERIYYFITKNPRIHVVDNFIKEKENTTLRIMDHGLETGYTTGNYSVLSSESLFQNLFLLQSLTEKPLKNMKYVEVHFPKSVGIGGVLSHYKQYSNSMAAKGLTLFLKPGSTRYADEFLQKNFKIPEVPLDSDDSNTIYIENNTPYQLSWHHNQYKADFDYSILSDSFQKELEEYADVVLAGKKVLGVLARGTDYITANLKDDRLHATVDQMLPRIHQLMEEEQYDLLFLATEDKDIADRMKKEFGNRLRMIAQERHSVDEFQNSTLIYELEKEQKKGEEYAASVADTTVNYFYALYILSKCDSFLCSGKCNGWDTVNSFNGGKFKYSYKFTVGVTGDPRTENFKEVRPIFAGLFARAVHPERTAFYMTYRFELEQDVDGEALKEAWKKTLEVYPYFRYAVVKRRKTYVLTENPLDFVIKNTRECVEPFESAGNFHTVTFCYDGNALNIYVDHVVTDGTGFRFVLETFFYNYYSLTDHMDYPVPDGVFTLETRDLEGQQEDAYLKAKSIDPLTLMQGQKEEADRYVDQDALKLPDHLTYSDCGRFLITVPSKELMAYAKSVKGSPMSVLSTILAQSVERTHPENTLPVKIMFLLSVRKAMDTPNSLLHQVILPDYSFDAAKLLSDNNAEMINTEFRAFLKGFSTKENLNMMSGIYRGIIEGYQKAILANVLDEIMEKQMKSRKPEIMASYIGTLRTGEYGNRIRMKAFHVMPGKETAIQMTEVGGFFYLCMQQGTKDDRLAKDMAEHMRSLGMEHAELSCI